MASDRDLDGYVDRVVFGLVPCTASCHKPEHQPVYCYAPADDPENGRYAPEYSAEIADAWKVVEYHRALFSRWIHFQEALKNVVSERLGGHNISQDFIWRLVQPRDFCIAAIQVAEKRDAARREEWWKPETEKA